MSEPKKQELANVQAQNLSLISSANVAKLVYRPAEETLVVHGTVIHCTDSGLYSMNDLHKASGADDSKRPYAFLRTKAAKDFVEALKAEGVENVYETVTGGADPGTYANKLLAYEYATYLDKTFRLKAMIVLDRVTVAQVEQVQVAYQSVVAELGEEKAKLLNTVAELGQAYQDLNMEKDCNNQLIFANRNSKKLKHDSPIVHELGLARNNVEYMYANLDQAQRQLINCYDFLDSLQRSVQQEANQPHVNNYYKKFFKGAVIDPIQSEFPDLKDCIKLNVKVLEAAKDYIATASKTVQAPKEGEDGKS